MALPRPPDTRVLSTVRYLPAVALVSYLFDRSHSWYAAFLKIFVLVQGLVSNYGNGTPQVIRHDRRTQAIDRSRRTAVFPMDDGSQRPR